MASHMDLLAASRFIDRNIDPEAGHVLLDGGDWTSFKNGPEIMHRAKSTPDLVARAAGMLGDSRDGLPGTADLLTASVMAGDERENSNNGRVAARMAADARREERPASDVLAKALFRQRLNGAPAFSATDHIALPIEGSNRDESGGANVGAQGAVAKVDEVPAEPTPPTAPIEWKKNV